MLTKTYNAKEIEPKLYRQWEEKGYFKAQHSKSPYTIMMPPPNVTGSLHLGHALNGTLQDILIRYKRMRGFDVLWQPGTDHAGIATQMVVERQLEKEELSRHDLGRKRFIEKVWQWKAYSGNTIIDQQKRLGLSCDWSKNRFTLDEGLNKAVRKVFVELYRQKLIYRDNRLINWDIKLQTALSDLEVINQEVKSKFYYIRYPLEEDTPSFLVIATTRPETMFGDTAVAVHPEDKRYKDFIGKFIHHPITHKRIPIIADEYCNPEIGTGAVKITPAHDFNDFEIGKRHQLPVINILHPDGTLNHYVPKSYQRLTIEKARQKILEELEAHVLIEKIDDLTHTVPYSERSQAVVEPYLTDQWFVNAKVLAKSALKAVQEGKTVFFPEHWTKTYFDWLENIQPWCISRQIWWGHQIPAWYGPDCHIFVFETEEEAYQEALKHYGQHVSLIRDNDVLDTWFSSSLWPFSTLGWPENTQELKTRYPTDVLVTGFDIIFFWVARMMVMGLHFMKEVPFKIVYIHALVRDEEGAKMSKSKGNIIDPLELLDQYGADALRFTLATLAVPGRDVKLGENRVENTRNFMTKIWNAARFLEHYQCGYDSSFDPSTVTSPLQKWIIHQVNEFIQKVTDALETYRFDEAALLLYHFIWGTYCDYYLEFLKPVLTKEESQAKQTAVWVFLQVLKLCHPFIPFITEELWQRLTQEGDIMISKWPTYRNDLQDQEAQEKLSHIVNVVKTIRSLRFIYHIPVGSLINLEILGSQNILKGYEKIIERLGRLNTICIKEDINLKKGTAQFVIDGIRYGLPLSDTIDLQAEQNRLLKDLKKLKADIKVCQMRLDSPDFIKKAKEEIKEEMINRIKTLQRDYEEVKTAYEALLI